MESDHLSLWLVFYGDLCQPRLVESSFLEITEMLLLLEKFWHITSEWNSLSPSSTSSLLWDKNRLLILHRQQVVSSPLRCLIFFKAQIHRSCQNYANYKVVCDMAVLSQSHLPPWTTETSHQSRKDWGGVVLTSTLSWAQKTGLCWLWAIHSWFWDSPPLNEVCHLNWS